MKRGFALLLVVLALALANFSSLSWTFTVQAQEQQDASACIAQDVASLINERGKEGDKDWIWKYAPYGVNVLRHASAVCREGNILKVESAVTWDANATEGRRWWFRRLGESQPYWFWPLSPVSCKPEPDNSEMCSVAFKPNLDPNAWVFINRFRPAYRYRWGSEHKLVEYNLWIFPDNIWIHFFPQPTLRLLNADYLTMYNAIGWNNTTAQDAIRRAQHLVGAVLAVKESSILAPALKPQGQGQ